ncbi:hypothetical protein BDQ12DRAFT_112667 [Crucibulum laeve]|uniref:Uncharacterized protein n=1 Tax=Crucibulum laeve TaxID=68775 RepID=A0A5C3M2S3_9AGAR|nr:hypothetical protein BDQ12DRAFT_112667 [Crucibulum laeve]
MKHVRRVMRPSSGRLTPSQKLHPVTLLLGTLKAYRQQIDCIESQLNTSAPNRNTLIVQLSGLLRKTYVSVGAGFLDNQLTSSSVISLNLWRNKTCAQVASQLASLAPTVSATWTLVVGKSFPQWSHPLRISEECGAQRNPAEQAVPFKMKISLPQPLFQYSAFQMWPFHSNNHFIPTNFSLLVNYIGTFIVVHTVLLHSGGLLELLEPSMDTCGGM